MNGRFHLVGVLATLLGLGCGSGKSDPASGGSSPAGAAKPAGDSKPVTAGAPTESKIGKDDADPERAKLTAAAAEIHEHLALAHEKADAGDWKAAVAAYEKAASLDDDNAKILGELGWAQFNGKDLDGAQRSLGLALRYARDRKHRADLQFKLGRVAEERGDFVRAKDHYDQSIALENSPEAQEREDVVGPKRAAICTDGGGCGEPHYADLQAACESMLARVHERTGLPREAADADFSCDAANPRKVAITGGDATEAAVLVVRGTHLGTTEEEHDLFARVAAGWHRVGTLLDLQNPHHGRTTRSGTLDTLEIKELLPDAPGQEVVVKVQAKESNADLDENIRYTQEHGAYIVCSIGEGTHACHEIPTRWSYRAEALDPAAPSRQDLETQEFTVEVSFDGKGNVTLARKGNAPSGGVENGVHAIGSLPPPHGLAFLHED
jgi:tetratricopeptide (TPR) repeat protein